MPNLEAVRGRYPLATNAYQDYYGFDKLTIKPEKRRRSQGLNLHKLSTTWLIKEERTKKIKVPTYGEASLVLSYDGDNIAVGSWEEKNGDLILLQLQQIRIPRAIQWYLIFDWPRFYADEALAIAQIPQTGIKRIAMPKLEDIPMLNEKKDIFDVDSDLLKKLAEYNFKRFRVYAMLGWSEEANHFVRDVNT